MDSKCAVGNGYGESKYVSERVSTSAFVKLNFSLICLNLFRFSPKVDYDRPPSELDRYPEAIRTVLGQLQIGYRFSSNRVSS